MTTVKQQKTSYLPLCSAHVELIRQQDVNFHYPDSTIQHLHKASIDKLVNDMNVSKLKKGNS